MKRYALTLLAQRDLEEIHDFIAIHHPHTALQFIHTLREKCRSLAMSPEMGTLRDDLSPGLRSFPIQKYVIFSPFLFIL